MNFDVNNDLSFIINKLHYWCPCDWSLSWICFYRGLWFTAVGESQVYCWWPIDPCMYVCVCVFPDRCCPDVWRGACGGCCSPAVSSNHRQFTPVQPAQALAIRQPLYGAHQRGTTHTLYLESMGKLLSNYSMWMSNARFWLVDMHSKMCSYFTGSHCWRSSTQVLCQLFLKVYTAYNSRRTKTHKVTKQANK